MRIVADRAAKILPLAAMVSLTVFQANATSPAAHAPADSGLNRVYRRGIEPRHVYIVQANTVQSARDCVVKVAGTVRQDLFDHSRSVGGSNRRASLAASLVKRPSRLQGSNARGAKLASGRKLIAEKK